MVFRTLQGQKSFPKPIKNTLNDIELERLVRDNIHVGYRINWSDIFEMSCSSVQVLNEFENDFMYKLQTLRNKNQSSHGQSMPRH